MPRMNASNRLLVVDDDPGICKLISGFLLRHGYPTDTADSAAHMRMRLDAQPYDLIVLDVMMPGEDGLSVLRSLQSPGAPPVIMLSAIGTDIDRIVGLEMGAEDYLAKPCNPRELLARIRTVLRRRAQAASDETAQTAEDAAEPALCFSGWRFDVVGRILQDPNNTVINLSNGEFRLLKALVERPRRVLTRDQLLDYSHGDDSQAYDRAIDVQMSRLRRKLGRSEGSGELIRTIRHEGYMFVPAVTRQ